MSDKSILTKQPTSRNVPNTQPTPQTQSQITSNSRLLYGSAFIFIVLLGAIIFMVYTDSGQKFVDTFKDKIFPKSQKLKDLDVMMFINPNCPHCVKTINVLQKENEINNIIIIDITKEEGKKIAEQFGADKRPVPSFISRKTSRSAIGSVDSVSQIIKALYSKQEPKESSEESSEEQNLENEIDIEQIKKMEIILFARDGCGWCSKAKEECEKTGISRSIKIIDVSTPEGQKVASELLPPEITGVPVWLSVTSRKHVVGYKPVQILLKELQ